MLVRENNENHFKTLSATATEVALVCFGIFFEKKRAEKGVTER